MWFMTRLSALCVALLLATACGGSEDVAAPADDCDAKATVPAPDPDFYTGRAILKGDEGSVLLDLEIAETPEQQALGLMHRTCLGHRDGMAFIFFEGNSGGFWMKDTLTPLSIAFFDKDGTILEILDMDPCEADPCESYDPGVSYFGALEVEQGNFAEWGIDKGDDVHIVHNERNKLFND